MKTAHHNVDMIDTQFRESEVDIHGVRYNGELYISLDDLLRQFAAWQSNSRPAYVKAYDNLFKWGASLKYTFKQLI